MLLLFVWLLLVLSLLLIIPITMTITIHLIIIIIVLPTVLEVHLFVCCCLYCFFARQVFLPRGSVTQATACDRGRIIIVRYIMCNFWRTHVLDKYATFACNDAMCCLKRHGKQHCCNTDTTCNDICWIW